PGTTGAIEELGRSVAFHPPFENANMFLLLVHLAHWDLMRTPVVFRALAIDLFWARPTLRRTKDDHRPARPLRGAISTCLGFDRLNLAADSIQSCSHEIMHRCRIMPLDKMRRVAITTEELIKLFMADAGENAGIGNFVPIKVQDRQNHPVRRRIQELV